ncbi:MAG: DUF5721 family protein [Eubacterium sp.]|nr:DUF5721 family protein [Eubacterium sp.]
MIVLKIESVKEFMACLFQGDMFDRFHLRNCQVRTFTNFSCDGSLYGDWFDTEEKPEESQVVWSQIKPIIFGLIRGNKPPLMMNLEFCHHMSNGDTGAIRVQYEKGELLVYTGYAQKEFSLDKSKQETWDDQCKEFIKKNEIVSTLLE